MMVRNSILILAVLPVISGGIKVVDLTWAHGPNTVFWPGSPPFNFTILSRQNLSKHWYEINWFGTAEHGGTHLDSPAHFSEGKWRMHEIPPERLIGPGVVIDVRSKVESNPDYRVTKTDFTDYEEANGRIPKGAVVIMNSGWGSRYPNMKQVFNSDDIGTIGTYHFPGFHEDGVSWLLTNRNISMIGVDTPSVDYGQSTDFKVHVMIGKNCVPSVENVANVEEVPVRGTTIFVGAIKLFDGSGGPARILAVYDENNHCSSGKDCPVKNPWT